MALLAWQAAGIDGLSCHVTGIHRCALLLVLRVGGELSVVEFVDDVQQPWQRRAVPIPRSGLRRAAVFACLARVLRCTRSARARGCCREHHGFTARALAAGRHVAGRLRRSIAAKLVLFCLARADGSASFFGRWQSAFGERLGVVALDYPERGTRASEVNARSLAELAGVMATAIAGRQAPGEPFALLGHSMSATIAWEVARCLEEGGDAKPQRLFLSSRDSPAFGSTCSPMT